MKKLGFFLCFSFFIFYFASAQEYRWIDISKMLPDTPYDTMLNIGRYGNDSIISSIADVYFINDTEGWITTSQVDENNHSFIFHTINGGLSWETQTVPAHCNFIRMSDSKYGYAFSPVDGAVFITQDAGHNWASWATTGEPITGISFPPGSDSGYICSGLGYYIHRINANGLIPIYLKYGDYAYGISATKDGVWLGTQSDLEFWNGITEHIEMEHENGNYLPFFVDARYGWLGSFTSILGFNDYSLPWTPLFNTENNQVIRIFALDTNHIWATIADGRILHSKNATEYGKTWSNVAWEDQPHPYSKTAILSVIFPSLNTGYAGGNRNVLLKYTNISDIERDKIADFQIIPNPSRGKFKIQDSRFKIQNCDIDLLDLFGRKVMDLCEGRPSSEVIEFDVGYLPAGLYIIRLNVENRCLTRKLVIFK